MIKALLLMVLFSAQNCFASLDSVMAVNSKKNNYRSDATFWGGDALANPVSLENVRWAPNGNYERIVVDLSGDGGGWETKVPPFFQVGIAGKEQKIMISIRGVAKRSLDGEKLAKSLARSSLITSTYLAPAIEGDLASFELQAKKPIAVETFYLVNPPRIIMDVRAE